MSYFLFAPFARVLQARFYAGHMSLIFAYMPLEIYSFVAIHYIAIKMKQN